MLRRCRAVDGFSRIPISGILVGIGVWQSKKQFKDKAMPLSHATIAEYYRLALIAGLLQPDDAKDWAMSLIEQLAAPPGDIIELSWSKGLTMTMENLAAVQGERDQQLASLRLYDPERTYPTHAGILLFGLRPRFHLSGAYIQFLKFPGTNLADLPQDQAEIAGDLQSVLREMEIRIRTLIQTTMVPASGFAEKLQPDYPEWALRELLMNAVMHRNYESNTPIRFYGFLDHIEIQNPGGLYGEATPENFPTRNSYRNPVIAEAMKALGFVNRFGYGVQRAQALLAQNGNPPAQFEFDAGTVSVRVYKRTG
jgi:predicted HTH transcriptional regulator